MSPQTLNLPLPIAFSPPLASLQPAATVVTCVQQPLFTAALIHEIRNPLTNINLAVEMLNRLTTGEQEKIYLDIILRASTQINALVTDLVSIVVIRKEHSLHQLLDDVLLVIADRITLKNITVIKEYGVRDFSGTLDCEKINIALTNIIINAIDAMPDKNGQLKLTTSMVNGRFELQINDNGCGISVASLEHIFEPYFTQKIGGLGIGLAATFEILKTNKVNMTVQSEIGTGTTFTLSFAKERSTIRKDRLQVIAA